MSCSAAPQAVGCMHATSVNSFIVDLIYMLPLRRVAVAGFSQGGAVALLMLRSDVRLAGVAGLSTWLTLADQPLLSDANQATPLWMGHGTADPVVRD